MGLVSTWLTGIGLSYAWPTFEAAGIVTPAALANLDVTVFAALGVNDAEDRRKLFYLVQRIKLAFVDNDTDQENVANTVDQLVNETLIQEGRHEEEEEEEEPHMSYYRNGSGMLPEVEQTDDEEEYQDTLQEEEETPVQEARRLLTAKVASPLAKPLTPRSASLGSFHSNPQSTNFPGTRRPSARSPRHATTEDLPHTNAPARASRMVQPGNTSNSSRGRELPQSRLPAKNGSRLTPVRNRSGRISRQPEKDENTQDDNAMRFDEPVEARHYQEPENNDANEANQSDQDFAWSAESRTTDSVALRTRSRSRGQQQKSNEATTPSRPSNAEPKSRLKTPTSATSAARTARSTQPKSNRTGKALSAIPSDRILPMSPLIEMHANSKKAAEERGASPLRSVSNGRQPERSRSHDSHGAKLSPKDTIPTSDSYDESDSEHSVGSTRSHRSTSSRTSTGSVIRHASSNGASARVQDVTRRKTVGTVIYRETSETSFKAQIEDLREDTAEEHALINIHDYMDDEEDMRIRVVVRKRPMSKAEVASAGDVDVIHPLDYGPYGRILVYQPRTRVDLTKEIETVPFSFDNVFDENSTNLQIYERTVRNLIPPLFEGQWGCVFAYGQTGSGKTFTMMGSNMTTNHGGSKNLKNLGLYYMAALDIFQALSTPGFDHFSVSVSLFEIYGGKLFDLLNSKTQIKCLEDHKGKVRFPGLTEHSLGSAEDLMDIIEEGASNRSTGSTSRNADSSRSHAVLQLHISQTSGARRRDKKNSEFSRLTFIDLAGSERGVDTSNASKETRMEGAEINTSLLALKEVIRALATGDTMTHVPFRGSKLTQVLKESFVGENCRSVMVACISPNISNCEQTLNTLRYANRVKERDSVSGQLPASARAFNGATKRASSVKSDDWDDESPPPERNSRRSVSAPVEIPCDEDECNHRNPHNPKRKEQADAESVSSCASDALDDILGESDPAGKAAQQVILTHKETMTRLLEMVKDEMALVNKAGNEGMEQYISSVSEIHSQQLQMYSALRDRIQEYRELRRDMGPPHTSDADDAGSVEDLRDF